MTKSKSSDTLPVDIGIEQETRDTNCCILSAVLADQHVLYIKKRNFHWNLIGGRFHTLHAFYEEQYGILEKAIDETAERIRQLGGTAPGSMAEFLELASLEELTGELVEGTDSIEILVKDHEAVIKALRSKISEIGETGDAGTEDFLTGLLQGHEKTAWMLRSFLR